MRNATNFGRWCDMLEALVQSFHIPGNFLQMLDDDLNDYAILYTTREGQKIIVVMHVWGSLGIGSRAGPLECGLQQSAANRDA